MRQGTVEKDAMFSSVRAAPTETSVAQLSPITCHTFTHISLHAYLSFVLHQTT